ncbi:MAG: adenylyl-sulfate kinase [Gammaproteobacteria bacterium]|nr:adenylyl-sulfate kinase [Gammaproteobacteria bacterium]
MDLKVVACGSVDDGKSTLIGRLLHDAGRISDDEREALRVASARHGTRGGAIDYALLLDGLEAEREQGITIDVAWRHLETPARRFLIADCPGHVQYTRNMATGASNADAAILLVDATRGLQPQSMRHAAIMAVLGVPEVVLAVNKLDLLEDPAAAFGDISSRFLAHAQRLGLGKVQAVPVSAVDGDNVVHPSRRWTWYAGQPLLGLLESLPARPEPGTGARLPVQGVQRDCDGGRWLTGTLHGAALEVGVELEAVPSGRSSPVASLRVAGAQTHSAPAGAAIAVRLADDIDVARGDLLVGPGPRPEISDQFVADLLWFDDAPLLPGRRYRFKLGTTSAGAYVSELRHQLDPMSLQPLAAKELRANDIGQVALAVDAPVAFAPYREDRVLGAFLLINPVNQATLGAGMIRHGLRRADNLRWQAFDVDRHVRAAQKGQRPLCVWFTGLSGAGKSTIANLVEQKLVHKGLHTFALDGDNVRHGLNRDLGFTDADRVENLRRVGEVARLMTDAGLIVLVSFISPFRAERAAARSLFDQGDFIEVFVDTPLAEAERRDAKGLYAKARAGQLPNFTGIDSPYEPPEAAELVLDTTAHQAADLADQVVAEVLARQDQAR